MSRYDDERLVALLHEVVPSVPDAPDRLAAIRDRAGRQRTTVWTQTLGAVASVVLVIGLAAAVANAGGAAVRPVDDPLAALARALDGDDSYRFELTTGLAAPITKPIDPILGVLPVTEQRLTSHVVGATAADGDTQVDGDLSILYPDEEFHMRIVDGAMYSVAPSVTRASLPEGKKWVLNGRPEEIAETDDSVRSFTRFVSGIAQDVRYVRRTTVRGTPVVEYVLTLPKRWTRMDDVQVTFALDARNRLRRVAAEVSYQAVNRAFQLADSDAPASPAPSAGPDGYDPLMLRVELLVWGYGDRVEVTAPPESEIYDPSTDGFSQEETTSPAQPPAEMQKLLDCFVDAKDDSAKRAECIRKHVPSDAPFGVVEDGVAVTPAP